MWLQLVCKHKRNVWLQEDLAKYYLDSCLFSQVLQLLPRQFI